jgi:hypothetical protein
MKKIFTSLFISTFFILSYPQSNNIVINKTQPKSLINFFAGSYQSAVADAMGYYCYVDEYGNSQVASSNEYPLEIVFSGYPIDISGTSFEGGILCNMDSDTDLEVVYNIGYTIQCWNFNGTSVPGWPKNVSYPLIGDPAYGDIDGDGEAEIVVAYALSSSGYVGAFEKNGSLVSGFPVNNGYIIRSPVLADVNGDGVDEIIVTKTTYPTGQVYIYKGDGTVLNGWPQPIDDIPASSSAVGDITNDNSSEIVVESYGSIYAFDSNGTLLSGFPFMLTGNDKTSYSSPVLVDVDNDNMREIVFGTHDIGSGVGRLHIIKNNGTEISNFPKITSYWIYGPPAVGYIDGNNILDIAIGDQVLSGSALNKLYAWNVNGQFLSGFPVGPLWAINDQVVIADIDNDNEPELVFDDNAYGEYHAYKNDGTLVSGWPIITNGITFFNTPALADVNGDNILDMLGAGITDIATNPMTHVYLWNLEVPYEPTRITIPVFQYNTKHNGVFVDPTIVPVELISFIAESNTKEVLLKWETATEVNNLGFEIERKFNSAEGRSEWITIGFKEGMGTTTELQKYLFVDEYPVKGIQYYRLKQIDFTGQYKYSGVVEVNFTNVDKYLLEQNYPNPFNPSTKISFSIPSPDFVTLKVFDVVGEEVATILNNEYQDAGEHSALFIVNSSLPSGIYFYKICAGSFNDTKKMILLK